MFSNTSVLVAGNGKMAGSVAACILQAGTPVALYTGGPPRNDLYAYWNDTLKHNASGGIEIITKLAYREDILLCIIVCPEDLDRKRELLQLAAQCLPAGAAIAVNTESFPLSQLQQGIDRPGRVLGLNWTEPATSTFFLELICNSNCDRALAQGLQQHAKDCWQKHPYTVYGDRGIRSRLVSAMAREACYLVQQGYAAVEDIDRACRNDAGYYLPFAGNCRYMDLMGTYAYGMVMKDLNPVLSKDTLLPPFFSSIVARGETGMQQGKGFYTYPPGAAAQWQALFNPFSQRIRELMEKYTLPEHDAPANDHTSTTGICNGS